MPIKKSKRPAKKRLGRPAVIDPKNLLDMAEELFSERGFEGTSIREVAKKARCNIAMIAYHFGNKEGLYDSVLERHVVALRDLMSEVFKGGDPVLPDGVVFQDKNERRFFAALYAVARMIGVDSRKRQVICREMMTGGKRLAAIIKESEGGLAAVMRQQVQALKDQGVFKKDLQVNVAVVSLLGPLVYSCIASPLLASVYGITKDRDEYARDLSLHLTRTVFEGWRK